MADNHRHLVADLTTLREALVNRRRQAAKSARELHLAPENGSDDAAGSSYGADILEIQKQIEAVDRAIADERKIDALEAQSGRVSTRPPRSQV